MPEVTIIVVPRERFSFTQESLESIYQNTDYPFQLVYVDNNSPKPIRAYLETAAKIRGFKLIQTNHYLSPNQARNLGLREVASQYVVFIDNDVVVAPGWLTNLVKCAEETGATIVGPLVCQHQPLHSIIHCAGGEYLPAEEMTAFLTEEKSKLHIKEIIYHQDEKVADLPLQRQTTGFIEFHCLLVRRAIFQQIGLLDEELLATKEYLDFCMSVVKAGGSIYLEPKSLVTFMTHFPAAPLAWFDLLYYMLRWSDAWEFSSLRHFQQKWQLEENEYFQKRYKQLGWRRYIEIVKPFSERFSFLGDLVSKLLARIFYRLEKLLNFYISSRYTL